MTQSRSLRSFLLTQSHGKAVDAIRSLNARRSREVRDGELTASATYDINNEAWDLALSDQVTRALDALTDQERKVIELAYFEGQTYAEVARTLDQPEGTVKSRIRKGMQRMRSVLVEAGIEGADA